MRAVSFVKTLSCMAVVTVATADQRLNSCRGIFNRQPHQAGTAMPPYQAALCSRQKASSCAEQQAHLSWNVAWKPRAHVLALQSMQTAMRPRSMQRQIASQSVPSRVPGMLEDPCKLAGSCKWAGDTCGPTCFQHTISKLQATNQ